MVEKRIGQLAAEFGVNPRTLRYYEAVGLLPAPARSAGGYRLYDEDTVGRLAFIGKAKDPGHTLGEKPTPTEGSIPSGMEVKVDDQGLPAGATGSPPLSQFSPLERGQQIFHAP